MPAPARVPARFEGRFARPRAESRGWPDACAVIGSPTEKELLPAAELLRQTDATF